MGEDKKDENVKIETGGCGDPNCKGCEEFRKSVTIETDEEKGIFTIKISNPSVVTPVLLADNGANVILSRDPKTGKPIDNIPNRLAGLVYAVLPLLIRMVNEGQEAKEGEDFELPPGTFPSKDIGNA